MVGTDSLPEILGHPLRRLRDYFRGPRKTIHAGGAYWPAWGDGYHDDTAAIRDAFRHAERFGKELTIPPGDCMLNQTVVVDEEADG